ncbi:MAG: CBS domain-containing protein [Pirellulaceae bacterium]|jgi:CBS domain-containing protein|nr:CBS domain-containing protein [Pirellulaceae bacterium]MDP7018337.1 CBS domain-containing protein [Pirellulaceae bacterium]
MIDCPNCSSENIDGADACEQCGQSLSDLHLPTPATEVERALLTDRVGVLPPKEVIAVTPTTTVADALSLLVEKKIGCLVVVDDDETVGIFTEVDAVRKINDALDDLQDRPIGDFMTPNPQRLEAGAKIAFAVHRMDLGGYRHVPIVDANGRTTGVISARDILRYLSEKMAS